MPWGVGAVRWGFRRGPKVWYQAYSLGYANNDPVATWDDISGNDYDAVQVTSGNRPVFKTGVLNGKAVVEFDGTNDAIRYGGAVGNATLEGNPSHEWHCFAVFKCDTSADQMIFNGDDQTSQPGTGRASQYLRNFSGPLISVPGSAVVESSGQTISTGTWHIGEAWASGTQVEALLDGVGNGPTSYTQALYESPNGFYVGYHPSAGLYFDGQIAEIIGFDRKLSSSERSGILARFHTDYGL